MASKLFVLLSLTLIIGAIASPVPKEEKDSVETTTAPEELEAVVEVDDIYVIGVKAETTTQAEAKETEHKLVKRSPLRGDNPSNDLLAERDGLNFENGLTSLEGRRIKFLPTWLG